MNKEDIINWDHNIAKVKYRDVIELVLRFSIMIIW